MVLYKEIASFSRRRKLEALCFDKAIVVAAKQVAYNRPYLAYALETKASNYQIFNVNLFQCHNVAIKLLLPEPPLMPSLDVADTILQQVINQFLQ